MDFQTLIEQCDLALRRGEIGLATELLKSLKYSKVPREFRLPLAKLCRRSGLWINGLRLLGKLVRPPEEGHPQATEVEMAEYALLLMKGGAIEEAKYILQNLSPQSVPELEMYQAFCEMAGWNYGETILLLKKYLASATNEYQKLIAKVNLAAALVWEEHTAEASVAVENLIYEAKSSNSLRLLANGLELRSQILIQAGDFEGCRKSLETANKLLSEGSSSDRLFIYKWQAICMALKNKNQQPLQDFRKIAESSLQWESVRECDFFSLRISFDEDLFRHLIMGTPHEPYRIKVCQTLNQAMPEGTFLYGAKDSPYLDLQTGLCTSGASLKG
ncbi:MAG: hypothetical protein ACXWRA_16530, partial [Pseudobdellovibrionaceae bacterium]